MCFAAHPNTPALPPSSSRSSMERIASKLPGSPWRPQRPASCRSILPASCRSVRITCSPPELRDARPQLDIRAAPGHVRRYGDGPVLAGLGHNRRLLAVVLRIEHLMAQTGFGEAPAQFLGSGDGACPDKDRAAAAEQVLDPFEHGAPLLCGRRHYRPPAGGCA